MSNGPQRCGGGDAASGPFPRVWLVTEAVLVGVAAAAAARVASGSAGRSGAAKAGERSDAASAPVTLSGDMAGFSAVLVTEALAGVGSDAADAAEDSAAPEAADAQVCRCGSEDAWAAARDSGWLPLAVAMLLPPSVAVAAGAARELGAAAGVADGLTTPRRFNGSDCSSDRTSSRASRGTVAGNSSAATGPPAPLPGAGPNASSPCPCPGPEPSTLPNRDAAGVSQSPSPCAATGAAAEEMRRCGCGGTMGSSHTTPAPSASRSKADASVQQKQNAGVDGSSALEPDPEAGA